MKFEGFQISYHSDAVEEMTGSKSLLACFALGMVLLPLATSSKDGVSQSQSDGDWEKRAIQQ